MPNLKYDVFISCARADGHKAAKRLCEELTGSGYRVYLDERRLDPEVEPRATRRQFSAAYKRRLHAGQQWWDEIVRRLECCEGLVYLLSPESVASEYCQREYALAHEAGKHIFPVLIQARTEIPDDLNPIQYADLSQGMEDIITLMNALTIAERQQRASVPAPMVSVQAPGDVSSNAVLAQAADAMESENFDGAVFVLKQALDKKPAGRIARLMQQMLEEAETALEKQTYLREASREYAPIVELVKRTATRALGCAEFAEFRQQYPDYDPQNVTAVWPNRRALRPNRAFRAWWSCCCRLSG